MIFCNIKKKIVTAGIIIFILLLSSCGKDAFVPVGYMRISDDTADYRFFVPDSWTEVNDGIICGAYVSATDRSSVTFTAFEINRAAFFATIGETGDSVAETSEITVSETEDSENTRLVTSEDFWKYYEKEFADNLGDIDYINYGTNLLISGIESKRYDYTATVSGTKYRFTQTVTVRNGTVYIMTFTTTPDLFEDHSDSIDGMIGYIEIK